MKKIIFIFILIAPGILHSCAERQDFKEGRFIISSKQTIQISAIGLSITNQGCGRKWINEGNNPGYERPYCDLVISKGDKTIIAGSDYKPVYLGNIVVQLEKINPWNNTEDSIPPGGCRVHVKLLDGR
jgi:hypothetical protein